MAKRWRDESLRLKNFDYSANGAFFVTLNTKNRIHYFGSISEGKMICSPIGELANNFWKEIPQHFPFVELDEFVVMPDHMHGIIIINKKREDARCLPNTGGMPNLGIPPGIPEGSGHPDRKGGGGHRKEWKPGSLGVILNQFKRICTIHARKIDPSFEWQSNYNDRIIWNDHSFFIIADYIRKNPENW